MSIYLNQRTQFRSRNNLPVQVSHKKGKECHSGEIFDCSSKGVSFLADTPYFPETEMNLKTIREHKPIPIRVVWSKPMQDDESDAPCYRVGAEFME